MFVGYGKSSTDYPIPGEAWYMPDRNNTCNFTSNGVLYAVKPDKSVPVGQRTKAQSGCRMDFDPTTNPKTGNFGRPTSASNYDPTVRGWYIATKASKKANWDGPYVFGAFDRSLACLPACLAARPPARTCTLLHLSFRACDLQLKMAR